MVLLRSASPKDLEPCDILRLKGVEDLVWSVEVLEYHGYIVVGELLSTSVPLIYSL